jgi:hypothetical protein
MKRFLVLASLIFLPAFSLAQSPATKSLSKVPLTPEQIAVYRAFLLNFGAGSDSPINVSDVTEKFQPDDGDFQGCMKGFARSQRTTEVHRFSNEFSDLRKIHLVDAKSQKLADPGDAIRKGSSVDDAVDAGIAAGVLRVSEILLDSKHHLAAFSYSFICGSLCGNGGTVVFKLQNGKWKRSNRNCGSWES